MNEIHITGIAKHTWSYDGNLFVRVSVARDGQRPARSPEQGGSYDYLTVMMPGGASQGLHIERGQRITAHGWMQSRDIHESLADLHRRAKGDDASDNGHPSTSSGDVLSLSKGHRLDGLTVHRSVHEVVVERWSVG
jgi:hypothetical protein